LVEFIKIEVVNQKIQTFFGAIAPPLTMIIEKLRKVDVDEASSLLIDIFDRMERVFPKKAISAFKSEYSESEIMKRISMDDKIFIVAKDQGKIVGILLGYLHSGVLYIVWLGVRKDSQGRGIGSALLDSVEKEFNKRCHKIQLISATGLGARGFYEKNGYSHEGIIKKSWWGVDYHNLGKVL
jgi:ribosomal protein S18 acetylase RimI-like enzyme